MIVTLSESELLLAGAVATQRVAQNCVKRRIHRYGYEGSNIGADLHFLGCIGELAVAKALNRYWSGSLGNIRAKDVSGVQVRATERPDGCLILHPDDKDDEYHFLVRVSGPQADICGFILGLEGKADKFWREKVPGRPAYFVPSEALSPIPENRAA